MAGTIPLSLSQQFDIYGQPLAGGQLYLIQSGTVSTPQNGYQDLNLTIPLPNPITLDAAGRIPQFFLADGLIKVRLQDKSGVVQLASDGIQVIGPSSGGGGGGGLSGDATQLWQTGDLKTRYSTGVHPTPSGGTSPGWVRANGLTIGSATASPSATERGNADCQALFLLLWPFTDLVVSSGRGASAAADWSSNKTITLPDYRGYALAALDDMGNTPAGRLTSTYFGTAATVLGAAGGSEHQALGYLNMPPYTPTGTVPILGGAYTDAIAYFGPVTTGGSGLAYYPNSVGASGFTDVGSQTSASLSAISASFHGDPNSGISQSFPIAGPMKLCTVYIKL